MNAKVTSDCVACGACVDICPEIFELPGDVAEVKVNPIPAEHEDAVQEAADACPTSAIIVEE